VVFGLVHLLGMQYRPALADLPDQKGWRIQDADYGTLTGSPAGRSTWARSGGDVARLSPFGRKHINVIGTYTFAPPDLGPGGVRDLRDPDADGDDLL
jgi:hypothetical protein